MKNISSQLNRGTELLKATVQRAIFSKAPDKPLDAIGAAKPTPYHSDPHAVVRSSSVDSLCLETCYIKPIRPYSLTSYRRGTHLKCPDVLRPHNDNVAAKISPPKVKARFKLQRGKGGSAFCSVLGKENQIQPAVSVGAVTNKSQAPKPTNSGRGTKRQRIPTVEEEAQEEVQIIEEEAAPKRGKKQTKSSAAKKPAAGVNKSSSKSAKKRKSLEQERQEREDFELAKRLQKELNSSNDSMVSVGTSSTRTRNGRSLTNSVNTNKSYSLRTTRSLSKFSLASSLSSSMILEEIDEEDEDGDEEEPQQREVVNRRGRVKTKKNNNKTHNSPPTKNGLTTTRDRIKGRVGTRTTKDTTTTTSSVVVETGKGRTTRARGNKGTK